MLAFVCEEAAKGEDRLWINLKTQIRFKRKKNQECGRDLANFYFLCAVRMLNEPANAYAFWGGIFSFFSSLPLCRFLFGNFSQIRAFDDTKHLIICYVTVLRARIFKRLVQ